MLTRRNRESYIAVQADIVDGAQAPDVTAAISKRLEKFAAALPPGYRIEAGGAVEESSKANVAIVAMLPLMVLLMLDDIMEQVRSFPTMFLVIATAPLGVIGAVPALLLTCRPFGFTAMFRSEAHTSELLSPILIY